MKKQNKIIIVLILIIVILLILFHPKENILTVKFYDNDGNLVKNSLSVVNGAGISGISFEIKAVNTGNVPLICNLTYANPIELDNSLDKQTKIAPSGGESVWVSNIIPVSQFESYPQPVNFNVSVSCLYKSGEQVINLPERSGSINLIIQKEINFRTSSLDYPSHGAVFYGTCNGDLVAYGEQSATCWTTTSLTCPVRSGYTLGLSNIPGSPLASDSPGCLYTQDNDPTRVAIAFKKTGSTGYRCVCQIQGQWCVFTYDSDDTDKDNVEQDLIPIYSSREIEC